MGRLRTAVLTMAMTAAGCATQAPGQPLPAPSKTSDPPSTSQSQSGGKAPPINSPNLDLAGYESRVCDLLTSSQLLPFAIHEPGKQKDGIAGPWCTWNPSDPSVGSRIDVTIVSKAEGGWEASYGRVRRAAFFEDAGEINGYPAVHWDREGNYTAKGICLTTVGVRRDLVLDVGVFVNGLKSPEYKDACSVSDKAASLVIDTLRGGR
jgi:hypothetical protein